MYSKKQGVRLRRHFGREEGCSKIMTVYDGEKKIRRQFLNKTWRNFLCCWGGPRRVPNLEGDQNLGDKPVNNPQTYCKRCQTENNLGTDNFVF